MALANPINVQKSFVRWQTVLPNTLGEEEKATPGGNTHSSDGRESCASLESEHRMSLF